MITWTFNDLPNAIFNEAAGFKRQRAEFGLTGR